MPRFALKGAIIEARRIRDYEKIEGGGLFMEGAPGWWRIKDGDAEFFLPHEEFSALAVPMDEEGARDFYKWRLSDTEKQEI